MLEICLLILFFTIWWLRKDSHKTILVYGIFNIFLQDYVCLRFEPPAIALRFLLDVIILWYAYCKNMIEFKVFPLKGSFIFLFLITILGVMVSPLSFTQTLPAAINKITPYLIVVLFCSHLQTKEDTEFAYKMVLWSFGILCLYAMVEFALQMNPVGEYVKTIVSDDLLRGKIYVASEYRFISVRCSSLLAICIAWGGYVCLIVACFFCVSGQSASKMKVALMVALLIFNVIISGSRSPMVFLSVIAIGFFFTSKLSAKLLLFILMGVFWINNQEFISTIFSSFSSDNTDIQGSSYEMRLNQYAAVSAVISESPFWGLGIKGFEVASKANSEILGAESIWLQQLIYSGLLGVIYQIVVYISILRYMISNKLNQSKLSCIVMVFGWISFCTLTSSPGLTEPYFLTICILVVRYFESHMQNKEG